MTFQLADHSIKHLVGLLVDGPIQAGKFIISCDFIVMDIDENSLISIILGRPFLTTAGAIIDCRKAP